MARPVLAEQFEDLETQAHAARLGMWVFLSSEVLLFAGLFALYGAYRVMYGAEFVEGVAHNDIVLGSVNTVVLITSSLTVALAIHGARTDQPRMTTGLLIATVALGAVFLVIKSIEYGHHFAEGIYPGQQYRYEALNTPGAKMFFTLYYFMSGLHALHVVAGLVLLGWALVRHRRRAFSSDDYVGLDLSGLYWHLVDVMWIFLWPLLYLAR
jgi:cytochrome c oxidase subunit III